MTPAPDAASASTPRPMPCSTHVRDLRDCTAYVTCQPCPTCAKLLAGAGLSRVIYPRDQADWHSPLVSLDLHDPDAVADPQRAASTT
jgi:tRNA(Arg) A34 adenosine deaminase TadA